MNRLDDLLILAAIAALATCYAATLAVANVSAHWLLIPALLLLGAYLVSRRERTAWRLRQQAFSGELAHVMSDYQSLSTAAMEHAHNQFTALEKQTYEAEHLVRESAGKL